MGHDRKQWVGIVFSCSAGKSPLKFFRSQGIFVNDLQVCVWWWGVMSRHWREKGISRKYNMLNFN